MSGILHVELCVDTEHNMLLNNYHVMAVDVLNAAQKFNLVALSASNKEDNYIFWVSSSLYQSKFSEDIRRIGYHCDNV